MERVLVPAFRALQRALYRIGFDLRRFSPAKGIPDAYLYGPYLQPWRSSDWSTRLRSVDATSLVTPDRKYILWQFAEQCARTGVGDFVECGVYRGGTAYLLAQTLHGTGKRLHLFDTFSGMPETDAEKDLHKAGDFADATLRGVRQYLSEFSNVEFHPGYIPETFDGAAISRISFAHIDLDIYKAIKDATAFVYDRMQKGAVIIYDDYGLPTCPGAREAVDEFFSDKPENVIALLTGQGLVIKS